MAREILQEAERFCREGIPLEAFERSKRALYGEIVSGLDNMGNVANGLVNMALRGRDLFAYVDSLADLKPEEASLRLGRIFREEQSVLSVILPLE